MGSSARVLTVVKPEGESELTFLRQRVAILEAENARFRKLLGMNADEKSGVLEVRVQTFKQFVDEVTKYRQEVMSNTEAKEEECRAKRSMIVQAVVRKMFPNCRKYSDLRAYDGSVEKVNFALRDIRALDVSIPLSHPYGEIFHIGTGLVDGVHFSDLEDSANIALTYIGKDNQLALQKIEHLTPMFWSYKSELEKSQQMITAHFAKLDEQYNKFIAEHSEYFPTKTMDQVLGAPLASSGTSAVPDAKAATLRK